MRKKQILDKFPVMPNKHLESAATSGVEDFDEFVCDGCDKPVLGHHLHVCETCNFDYGLCDECAHTKAQELHAHPLTDIPNIFNCSDYNLAITGSMVIAKDLPTLLLLSRHPFTHLLSIAEELPLTDPPHLQVTVYNRLYEQGVIGIMDACRLETVMPMFPTNVTIETSPTLGKTLLTCQAHLPKETRQELAEVVNASKSQPNLTAAEENLLTAAAELAKPTDASSELGPDWVITSSGGGGEKVDEQPISRADMTSSAPVGK